MYCETYLIKWKKLKNIVPIKAVKLWTYNWNTFWQLLSICSSITVQRQFYFHLCFTVIFVSKKSAKPNYLIGCKIGCEVTPEYFKMRNVLHYLQISKQIRERLLGSLSLYHYVLLFWHMCGSDCTLKNCENEEKYVLTVFISLHLLALQIISTMFSFLSINPSIYLYY